jgi:hypothetical protein
MLAGDLDCDTGKIAIMSYVVIYLLDPIGAPRAGAQATPI